jgi:hypothetical protein
MENELKWKINFKGKSIIINYLKNIDYVNKTMILFVLYYIVALIDGMNLMKNGV